MVASITSINKYSPRFLRSKDHEYLVNVGSSEKPFYISAINSWGLVELCEVDKVENAQTISLNELEKSIFSPIKHIPKIEEDSMIVSSDANSTNFHIFSSPYNGNGLLSGSRYSFSLSGISDNEPMCKIDLLQFLQNLLFCENVFLESVVSEREIRQKLNSYGLFNIISEYERYHDVQMF